MDRKDLNATVTSYVKYVNENKSKLGIEEDQMISTKLSPKEMELECEKIGEIIGDSLIEEDVPEEFINIYAAVAEAFEEFYAEDPSTEIKDTKSSGKDEDDEEPPDPDEPREVSSKSSASDKKTAAVSKKTNTKSDVTGNSKSKKARTKVDNKSGSSNKNSNSTSTKTIGDNSFDDKEKDKAIKKLFDLLPEESIGSLDTATMRTVLLAMK